MTNLDSIVTIKHGALRGKCEQTPKGNRFFSFQGIPFAQPPIGNLRFKAPRVLDPWQGIKDATQDGQPCYSKDVPFEKIEGSEDCLFLNVYTPIMPSETSELKAVMVWIHSGGFVSGSNTRNLYGPEFLIDKDIVLVAINYRLGALGFLRLNDCSLGVSGNAGMKDQVMGLKWVQDNIKHFGGDPDNVTIVGESAGAASVGFHLVSPMSKGLFHKAIMQSGSTPSPWAMNSKNSAYELAQLLGESCEDDVEVLRILQSATKEELLGAQILLDEPFKPSVERWFCPTVEDPNSDEEIFLPDEPMNLMASGNFHQVPVIIGYTSGEAWYMPGIEKLLKRSLRPTCDEDYIPCTFGFEKGLEKTMEIGTKIREFYYGQKIPSEENLHIWIDYYSDSYIKRSCLQSAENIMNSSPEKVFLYKFDLKTELNLMSPLFGGRKVDVCHGDDVFYLFNSVITPPFDDDSVEGVAMERITKWWTNFAKHGDPNGMDDDPIFASIKWPVANLTEMQYMHIDNELSAKNNLDKKMNDFWKFIETM